MFKLELTQKLSLTHHLNFKSDLSNIKVKNKTFDDLEEKVIFMYNFDGEEEEEEEEEEEDVDLDLDLDRTFIRVKFVSELYANDFLMFLFALFSYH